MASYPEETGRLSGRTVMPLSHLGNHGLLLRTWDFARGARREEESSLAWLIRRLLCRLEIYRRAFFFIHHRYMEIKYFPSKKAYPSRSPGDILFFLFFYFCCMFCNVFSLWYSSSEARPLLLLIIETPS